MPKAILTFTLPEEQHEFDLANNACKLSSIIYEFTNHCRNKTKYGDGKDVSWETVREDWWNLLKEENYDPYEGA